MKRKTFIKCLMALGVSRNEANRLCANMLSEYRSSRKDGKLLTWAYVLMDCLNWKHELIKEYGPQKPGASYEVYDRNCDGDSWKMYKVYNGEFYWNDGKRGA